MTGSSGRLELPMNHIDTDLPPPIDSLPRPSWDLWFMRQAYVTAQRGSCRRKQVGSIIVRDVDKRVVSGGYNGAPRGMPDCLEAGCDVRVIDGRESCVRTIHAESNALDLAGLIIGEPHTLYTTVIPCKLCALRIIQAGIRRVVYHERYISQGTLEIEALFARRDPDSLKQCADRYGNPDALDAPYRISPRVIIQQLELVDTLVKPSYTP